MRDPYEVLGITRNATMDEVKKAYRDLSRKYHPDSYIDNPLSDLATEKFKEVQEAYDRIVKERENSSYGHSGFQGNRYSNASGSNQNSTYSIVNEYINKRQYKEALMLLSGMQREAHWYYLSAVCNVGMGNNWQAMQHAQQAVQMDPTNQEYQNFYSRLRFGNQSYNQTGYQTYGRNSGSNDDCCDMCCKLWLLDTCCECMGGDLCSCI